MSEWTPDLTGAAGPKYQAVADAISDAIKRGELRAGDRLPPQRQLAGRLGFDLTTITRAYEIAQQRGHLVARGRAGSFVREAGRTAVPASGQVDTGMNTPPMAPGGLLQQAFASGLQAAAAGAGMADFLYQSAGGSAEARRCGALLLERMGLRSEPGQIVVTSGGQNGLHAIMNAIARPGDRIACGRFVYPGFRAIAQRMGVELVPLPELTAAALRDTCADGPLRALYLVPTNDNPTTATVPPAERELIAEAVLKEGIQLIEDDAYGLLDPQPLAPISRFVPGQAWYVLSTSKTVSPALRVAFVRAPGVGQALQLAADVHETAVMAPPLNAAMVSAWLADGTFDRLISATRGEAAWRLRLAQGVLGGEDLSCHPNGYHLWLRLPPGVQANDVSQTLAAAGIGTVPSGRFAVGSNEEQALRISLGGVADKPTLEGALRTLQGHLSAALHRWDAVI